MKWISLDCLVFFLVLNELTLFPSDAITSKLLFRLSELNSNALYDISKIFDNLPESDETKDILFNISKNRAGFTLYKVLDKLQPLNNIEPKTLLNISEMSMYQLNDLYDILEILPLNKITQEILRNFSKMQPYELYPIFLIFDKLPLNNIDAEILFNISKMKSGTVDTLYDVLDKLQPLDNIPQEILLNISKMDKDTLYDLYNEIKDISDDKTKMEVLNKYGV